MEIKNIAWATDFHPLSNHTFEWAKLFAERFRATLYAVHVIPEKKPFFSALKREELENMFNLIEKETKERAEKIFKKKKEDVGGRFKFEAFLLKGEITSKIVEFINERDIELLIIGSSRVSERRKIGTTAYRILTNVRIPVIVVPCERKVKLSKILVPIDFTRFSFKALEYVVGLSEKFEYEIHLLHVIEILESIGLKEVEERLLEETKNLLKKESERFKGKYKIFVNAIKRDEAEIGIIEFAQENDIDLICMTTRGRKGISHFLLGSSTEKVIKLSDIPVLAFNPVI